MATKLLTGHDRTSSCSSALGSAFLVLAVAGPAAAADPRLRWVRSDPASSTSAAVVVDPAMPLVHTTQLWPQDDQGRIVGPGDADAQAEAALGRLENALRE